MSIYLSTPLLTHTVRAVTYGVVITHALMHLSSFYPLVDLMGHYSRHLGAVIAPSLTPHKVLTGPRAVACPCTFGAHGALDLRVHSATNIKLPYW